MIGSLEASSSCVVNGVQEVGHANDITSIPNGDKSVPESHSVLGGLMLL